MLWLGAAAGHVAGGDDCVDVNSNGILYASRVSAGER